MELTNEQEQWLEALESGHFRQGQGKLCRKTIDGQKFFCCLGVACEIFEIPITPSRGIISGEEHIKYAGQSAYLPIEVAKLLKLRSVQGKFIGSIASYESLVDLNDIAGLSLKEIAKFIRAYPEQVFLDEGEFDELV